MILLHDTDQQAAEALPGIIAHYRSSGSRFAGVDELLAVTARPHPEPPVSLWEPRTAA